MNRTVSTVVQALLVVSLPLLFLTGVVRGLLATDTILRVEYYRPDFSPDGYRFVPSGPLWAPDERLRYGRQTQVWLRDGKPLADLAAVRQDTGAPLYTPSELGHMDDVQRLTNLISRVLLIGSVIAVLGIALLAWRKQSRAIAGALLGGGVLTWGVIGLLAAMLLGGVNSGSWDALFVGFHQTFFPQGNWQFAYSDSLIRLFPEQLWFDVAALMLGGTLLLAAISGIAGWVWLRRLGNRR